MVLGLRSDSHFGLLSVYFKLTLSKTGFWKYCSLLKAPATSSANVSGFVLHPLSTLASTITQTQVLSDFDSD